MAFKFNNGRGALICDRCDIVIIAGVAKDEVPDAQHICHKCGPAAKAELVRRKKLYAA